MQLGGGRALSLSCLHDADGDNADSSVDALKMLLLGDELVGVSRSCVLNMAEACEKLQGVNKGGIAIVWVSHAVQAAVTWLLVLPYVDTF